MMLRYIIGAAIGGLVGYFVLYKLIGCSTGACPITANPYASTVYGVILGALVANMFTFPAKQPATGSAGGPGNITYRNVTAQEAKARMDSGDAVIVLDVRTKEEYDLGHVPNAILIPNETIFDEKPELLPDSDAEILVYCRSGNRSAQAARKLAAMGYTQVYNFGGIMDWPYEKVTED